MQYNNTRLLIIYSKKYIILIVICKYVGAVPFSNVACISNVFPIVVDKVKKNNSNLGHFQCSSITSIPYRAYYQH